MAKLVVVVPCMPELFTNPVKQWNLSIRIVPPDHQDDAVNQNQHVCKTR
jgi:hypothetical protein